MSDQEKIIIKNIHTKLIRGECLRASGLDVRSKYEVFALFEKFSISITHVGSETNAPYYSIMITKPNNNKSIKENHIMMEQEMKMIKTEEERLTWRNKWSMEYDKLFIEGNDSYSKEIFELISQIIIKGRPVENEIPKNIPEIEEFVLITS